VRFATASLLLPLAACIHLETEYMRDGANPPATKEGDAIVVVFRPSTFGGNTQFPIFEFRNDEVNLMGFSESGCYFEYRCPAGKHVFLTWGEGTAYIEADLAAKKTYYIRCFAKLGLLAPRPRFDPVCPESEEWKNLDEELKGLKYRELIPEKGEIFEESKEERAKKAKASFEEGKKRPTYLKSDCAR
jgi:hypothetical protein